MCLKETSFFSLDRRYSSVAHPSLQDTVSRASVNQSGRNFLGPQPWKIVTPWQGEAQGATPRSQRTYSTEADPRRQLSKELNTVSCPDS